MGNKIRKYEGWLVSVKIESLLLTFFYRVIFNFPCFSSAASNRTSLSLLIFHIAHWYTIATGQAKLQSVFLLLSAHTSDWAAARWFIREGFTIGKGEIISVCFSHTNKIISVVDTFAALPEPCYAYLKTEILLSKCQEIFPLNQWFCFVRHISAAVSCLTELWQSYFVPLQSTFLQN